MSASVSRKTCLTHIDVAVALPIHHTFTYAVPEAFSTFAAIGKRVLLPFGQRKATGYILGAAEPIAEKKKIKPIFDVLDELPLFPQTMIPFFKWVASYYMYPIGEVIKCALPGGMNLYDFVSIEITEKGRTPLKSRELTPLETNILNHLQKGPCRLKNLHKQLKADIPAACIHKMEWCGLIKKQRVLSGGDTKPRMERYVALRRRYETTHGTICCLEAAGSVG